MPVLNVSSLDRARRIARLLQRELARLGQARTLSACQDLYARMLGFEGWRDLLARNDPSRPHALDGEVTKGEAIARDRHQFAVLRGAGIPAYASCMALSETRPTGSFSARTQGHRPPTASIFEAMGPSLLRNGWDARPEGLDTGPIPPDGAPDWFAASRGVNVEMRTGAVTAVAVEAACEGDSHRIQRLARDILGLSPFRRIGKVTDITLLYRSDPRAAATSRDVALPGAGRMRILAEGEPVTLYGIHPVSGNYVQWLGKHPARLGPEAAPVACAAKLGVLVEAVLAPPVPGR